MGKRKTKKPRTDELPPPPPLNTDYTSVLNLADRVVSACNEYKKDDKVAFGKACLQMVAREFARNGEKWWTNRPEYIRENINKILRAIAPLMGESNSMIIAIAGTIAMKQDVRNQIEDIAVDDKFISEQLVESDDEDDESDDKDAAAAAAEAALATLGSAGGNPFEQLGIMYNDVLNRLTALEHNHEKLKQDLADMQHKYETVAIKYNELADNK